VRRYAGDSRRTEPGVLGERVIITGCSGSGKSTLAAVLAERMGAPFIDLDEINWEPNWTPAPAEVFAHRLRAAMSDERWVISGGYFDQTRPIAWPAATTIVYLDVPLPLLLLRLLRRSWRRWRTKEVLWGTNTERFLAHFTSRNSIFLWTVRSYPRWRERWLQVTTDPEIAHVRFVRLCSPREIEEWLEAVAPAASRHKTDAS
jgi:adenylate kinase family enzyme